MTFFLIVIYLLVDFMKYVCDCNRHLVCIPYSKENLHKMSDELGIKNVGFIKIIMIFLKEELTKYKIGVE